MDPSAVHAAGPLVLTPRADPSEARLVERVIAVARALLAITAIAVVNLDPPEPARFVPVTLALLVIYTLFAAAIVALLLTATQLPRWMPIATHSLDVAFAALITLFSAGPNSRLFTFLYYPLLTAAYRWGFSEVMLTAAVVDGLLGLQALAMMTAWLPNITAGEGLDVNSLILRAIYVAATGAAVGYLAENEKRRRLEADAVSFVLSRARMGRRLTDTVNLVLASVRRVFKAKQVLLVLEELSTERVLLWASDVRTENTARPEQLPGTRRDDYLFAAPGAAWHAAVGALPGHWRSFTATALDEEGKQIRGGPIELPRGFFDMHPCRRLIGTTLRLSEEWRGRLFVISPALGVRREESARFALQLANHVAPAMYGQYVVRFLRNRAQALERARIARELHDGITQSLLGLEMELVVLRRRAMVDAPELAPELARLHSIVRNEVIGVRELMEGVRVGDVEADNFLQHLGEVVDRFSRYTGIVARFASDGEAVAFSPYVRRQIARIVHEALVNVRKHSRADHAFVRASVDGAKWRVTIEDNGQGFPFAGERTQEQLDARREGPRMIGERVRLIGGTMRVESRPGMGSQVEITVPVH